MWSEEDVHTSTWDLKKRYKICKFGLKAKTHRTLKQTCQLLVCSPAVALLHKKGPRHRRKICANSLWLYPYNTQSSLSKNKNINHIFTYLQVFCCLSSGSVYNITIRLFGVIYRTLTGWAFPLCRDTVGRFCWSNSTS